MTYRDRSLQCPRCGGELNRRDTRDAWTCARCRGALLGVSDTAQQLVEVAPDLAPQGEHVRDLPTIGRRTAAPPIACPACDAPMEPVFLGGLDVDRCYHDELLWFDAGELERVLETAAVQRDDRRPGLLARILRGLFG